MGIIGGLFNLVSQENQQSWNEKMYREQKDFWYDQQEYNSPENQVERLREAGINPQLAIGNIQSGQMGSSPSVPTMSPAHVSGATDSILSIINNKKQQNLLDAEARKRNADAFLDEIDSFTKFADNIQKIKESMSREGKYRADELLAGVTATTTEMMAEVNAAESESRTELNWLNYAKGLTELKYLPVQQRLEYLERMAGIAKIKAETSESKQRKLKLMQETNKEFFKAQGEKFINDLNKKTEQFLIDKRQLESYPESAGRIAGGIAREGSKFLDEFLGF